MLGGSFCETAPWQKLKEDGMSVVVKHFSDGVVDCSEVSHSFDEIEGGPFFIFSRGKFVCPLGHL